MYLCGLAHTHWLRMKTGFYLLTFKKCISIIGRGFFCFIFSEIISQSLPMNYSDVLRQEFSPNIVPVAVCGGHKWPGSGVGAAALGALVCSCAGGWLAWKENEESTGQLKFDHKVFLTNPGQHKFSFFSLMSALQLVCLLQVCSLHMSLSRLSHDSLWYWLFKFILDLLIFSFW